MAGFTQEEIRLAQESQSKYGVPASVTLAQFALESGWGSSSLANKANNYFGITGKNQNTGQYIMLNGRSWRSYSSKAESFDDHGKLLSKPLYTSKTSGATNVYEYVHAMAETYAPSSDGNNGYADNIMKIINQYNLTQYDNVSGGITSDTLINSGVSGGAASGVPFSYTGNGSDLTAFGVDWGEIIGKIIKFTSLVLVGVLAAVFFFNAFNVTPKSIASKIVQKKTGVDVEKIAEGVSVNE